MNIQKYIEWALSILSAFLVVYLLNIAVSRKDDWRLKIVVFIIKVLAFAGLAFLLIALAHPILWKYGYPFAGLYVVLLADCLCDLVMFVIALFTRKGYKTVRLIVSIIVTLIVVLYGTINSQIIRKNEITYYSSKLNSEHRFVFISDLHYGSSQRQDTIEKALSEINALKPEFVLLGGDITDEKTSRENMEWIFNKLGSLDTKVFYIYGNHDRQDRGDYVGGRKYTEQELEDAIVNNGLIILKDDYTIINELVILGREDISRPDRVPLPDLKKLPDNKYVICVDHSPYQNEEIREMKADLQLSGHTHAGQFFPLHLVYSLAGLNVVNDYRFDDTDLFVSPGIGGWFYPYRNEANCQYEVVRLIPE